MTCGIYRIVNKLNGKCYVGQSVDIERRFEEHNKKYRNYKGEPYRRLYDALHKYGIYNFESELLELCGPEKLNEREIHWINYFDSLRNGYNMTIGGKSCAGENHPSAKLTDEEVTEIKFLLKESNKSIKEISDLFNYSEDMVSMINLGKAWVHLGNYTYPIRTNNIGTWCEVCGVQINWSSTVCRDCYGKSMAGGGNNNSKLSIDEVLKIKSILKEGRTTLVGIAKLFKVSDFAISQINQGKSWHSVGDYTYPIKDTPYKTNRCKDCGVEITVKAELCTECYRNALGRRRGENHPQATVGEGQVREIKWLLKNRHDLSINNIARKFKVGRDCVSHINRGASWIHVDGNKYTYPIR